MAKKNTLQAMLDRAKGNREAISSTSPKPDVSSRKPTLNGRKGTKLIGGHFSPEVSTQLRILAAEQETTVQSLLGEALDDLFVKKGRCRIISR